MSQLTPANDARHHILSGRKIDGLFRVVISGTRSIARRPDGRPVDGKGHPTLSKAYRQAGAINHANVEARRIQPPCR
jgi:hypothetical protein